MKDVADFLDTLTCTKPWTLDDSRELYTLLRGRVDKDTTVDVYSLHTAAGGQQIFVTIISPRGSITKVYDAV